MRKASILAARAMILLLLLAAVFDAPLPAKSRPRVRLHLVDRSGSTGVAGPPESLTWDDARRIIEWDVASRAPGDAVRWAAFGADVAFESTAVDPEATDLARALLRALAENPTEVVLYTDGRADPGPSLLHCKARSVPVHVVPLGPVEVRDARISRVAAPEAPSASERVPLEVTVESTFSGRLTLRMNDESRDVEAAAGVPVIVVFQAAAGPFRLRLEVDDACPQNDAAEGEIVARSDAPKLLVVSEGAPEFPGHDVRRTPRFERPEPYDAVVLDNVPLSRDQQASLAGYVRDFGGGLLLLGGRRSYALGGWSGTPIEEVSPLRARPDQNVAVVFALDSSGSMGEGRYYAVARAVLRALDADLFRAGDRVYTLTCSQNRIYQDPSELLGVRPEGPTFIQRSLQEGRRQLESQDLQRKHIVVLTDGEINEEDKPQEEADGLRDKGIGLTVVTTNKELPVGTQVKIKDWDQLFGRLQELLWGIQDVERDKPGRMEPRDHPVRVPAAELPWMNLTSAKPDAQLAAVVRINPTVYPAVAFRETGRGRAGAFAFAYDPAFRALYRDAVEHLAGDAPGGLRLSIDPPAVRARGTAPSPRVEIAFRVHPSGESGTLILEQTRRDLWEGTLPPTKPGTVYVRAGRARAAATVPCAAEYRALGVDRRALERIAEETGGRVLRSRADVEGLPRPEGRVWRGARSAFLVAALILVFVELALTTFWKP
jgi:hypothetical protein